MQNTLVKISLNPTGTMTPAGTMTRFPYRLVIINNNNSVEMKIVWYA
jgi:hypothetical protein